MSETILKKGQTSHAVVSFASTIQPLQQMIRRESGSHEDLEALREEARQVGYREGLEKGTRQGESTGYLAGIKRGKIDGEKSARAEVIGLHEQAMAELAEELKALSAMNQAALEVWAKSAESALVDRVVDLTRQVLCQELTLSRESLIPMVAAAVREVANARSARIRVNPFDHHLLAERKADLIALTANLQHLEIVDDPAIFGGAIVETDGGKVDATVDGKLISFQAELEGAVASSVTPDVAPDQSEAQDEVA